MGCNCKGNYDGNYNEYDFGLYCVMAVAREIRPKKVLERVPLHANFPAKTDYDVDFTCSDTCFHKFIMQAEFIDNDYDSDLEPIWTVDWEDPTSVYYSLDQAWDNQIYGRI